MAAARANPTVRCIGVEMSKEFAAKAVARVAAEPEEVRCRIEIICGDAVAAAASPELGGRATVVFLYLVPAGLALIAPLLLPHVKRGKMRVVTNIFSLKGWEKEEEEEQEGTGRRVGDGGGGLAAAAAAAAAGGGAAAAAASSTGLLRRKQTTSSGGGLPVYLYAKPGVR